MLAGDGVGWIKDVERLQVTFCERLSFPEFDEAAADDMLCRDHTREAVRFWKEVVENTRELKI